MRCPPGCGPTGSTANGSWSRRTRPASSASWSPLQEHVPEHALSRVSSYDYLTSAGLIPLGNLLSGTVVAAVGLHRALVGMSAIGVAASLAVVALPTVRHLPRHPGDAVPTGTS